MGDFNEEYIKALVLQNTLQHIQAVRILAGPSGPIIKKKSQEINIITPYSQAAQYQFQHGSHELACSM